MSGWRIGRRAPRRDPSAAVPGAGTAPSGDPGAAGSAAGPAAGSAAGSGAPSAAASGVPEAALTVDALGRKCPIPIIMLAERIREVPVGAVIAVLADDPATQTDIPAWCGMKSQQFVAELPLERGWSFLVRRAY